MASRRHTIYFSAIGSFVTVQRDDQGKQWLIMKDTVGFWVMYYPVLNETPLTIVVYRTAETYESGRMERFNRLKTVSPQKFRRNTSDYMMINKTTYLNIL